MLLHMEFDFHIFLGFAQNRYTFANFWQLSEFGSFIRALKCKQWIACFKSCPNDVSKKADDWKLSPVVACFEASYWKLSAVILVRLSLLTMTNPNQLCDVCSKMADETNLSSKLPVADRTRKVWGRKLCWWCLSSGFPLCTFLLGFADSFCFVFTSSPFYEASPLCTILCNLFPWLCWYVEVFKGGFEGVLVSLLLTTMGAFSYLKFSIEDFLWQTFIRHSGNMACPS